MSLGNHSDTFGWDWKLLVGIPNQIWLWKEGLWDPYPFKILSNGPSLGARSASSSTNLSFVLSIANVGIGWRLYQLQAAKLAFSNFCVGRVVMLAILAYIPNGEIWILHHSLPQTTQMMNNRIILNSFHKVCQNSTFCAWIFQTPPFPPQSLR